MHFSFDTIHCTSLQGTAKIDLQILKKRKKIGLLLLLVCYLLPWQLSIQYNKAFYVWIMYCIGIWCTLNYDAMDLLNKMNQFKKTAKNYIKALENIK